MGNQWTTKTRCKNGHLFTAETTRIRPGTNARTCIICEKNYNEKYREDNKEHIREHKKAHRPPPHTPEYMRKFNLKAHGWTVEHFDSVLQLQEFRCAICGDLLDLENRQSRKGPCGDHEHVKPPRPRGILCHPCNAAIGLLQDNPTIMRLAADYVERYGR
jgi:hypothetical protein